MSSWRFLATIGLLTISAPVAAQSPDLVKRGEYLVNGPGNCGNCHTVRGPDLMPGPRFLAGGQKFDSPAYGLAYSRNITPDRETGIGTWTEEQIMRAVRGGITKEGNKIGEPMPIENLNQMSLADARAIAAYLRTIPAIRNEVPESRYKTPPQSPPPAHVTDTPPATDKLAYGAYLVTVAHCNECHTPSEADGKRDYVRRMGSGGRPFFTIPGKIVRSANITPDKETGIGSWTDQEIRRAMTEGISRNGRKLIPQMPDRKSTRLNSSH